MIGTVLRLSAFLFLVCLFLIGFAYLNLLIIAIKVAIREKDYRAGLRFMTTVLGELNKE